MTAASSSPSDWTIAYGHLAQVVVGYANDQAGQHVRVLAQRGLDLGGIDVAAADGEHVDAPVVEVEEAVGIEVAEVAE